MTRVKNSKELDHSWTQLQLRHGSWPKFAGRYGGQTGPAKPVEVTREGTTTGRLTASGFQQWHLQEVDHQGPDVLVVDLDLAKLEHRALALMAAENKVADIAHAYDMPKALFIERFGREAWEERELRAKQVVHTVVPLHKSNYVLVTDPELIPGMVSKSGQK